MSDDFSQELRAFEGSEALANGDFSVCIRSADLIEAQAARIAELEAALNTIIDKTGRAHPMSYVADIWRIASAALAGEKS